MAVLLTKYLTEDIVYGTFAGVIRTSCSILRIAFQHVGNIS